MYFDRFDICTAYFVFAMLHHGGQRCPIYAIFGRLDRMRFRPSPLLSGPESLEGNALEIYRVLCDRHGFES